MIYETSNGIRWTPRPLAWPRGKLVKAPAPRTLEQAKKEMKRA